MPPSGQERLWNLRGAQDQRSFKNETPFVFTVWEHAYISKSLEIHALEYFTAQGFRVAREEEAILHLLVEGLACESSIVGYRAIQRTQLFRIKRPFRS